MSHNRFSCLKPTNSSDPSGNRYKAPGRQNRFPNPPLLYRGLSLLLLSLFTTKLFLLSGAGNLVHWLIFA